MEDHSPYQASHAAPTDTTTERLRVNRIPHEIGGPIKHLWVLAIVLGVISLLVSFSQLMPQIERFRNGDIALLLLVLTVGATAFDGVVYLATAWGIRRYSRAAACVLLGYYLLGQTLSFLFTQRSLLAGLSLAVIISFMMIRGTRATFAYHRYATQEARRPPRGRLSGDPLFAPKVDA